MESRDALIKHERAFRQGRPPASYWAKWGAHSAGMTLAVRVPHGIRHTRAPRYQAETESPWTNGSDNGTRQGLGAKVDS